MIDKLARNPATLYLLLAGYFAVNILIRLSTPSSLELDEGQQLYFAQWLSLGYGPQPPLYNWLQYGMVQVFGNSVLALTLLKNTILFLSFALFGLAAQIVLRDRVLAIMATLGLFTIPQISYEAQRDLTHTVAMFFAACLFLYALVRTIDRPTLFNYGLAGLAVGLGMLAKYNFVLLPASAILALASDRQLRARLFDPRLLATVVVAAIVVAPHAWWFLDHMAEATSSTLSKMNRDNAVGASRLKGLLSLAEAVAAISLPTLAVFFLAFGTRLRRAWAADSMWTRLLGRILIAAVVLLTLIVLSGAASYIRHRWLTALFFVLPLYLAAKIEAAGETVTPGARRRFAVPVAAVMILVPLILLGRPLGLAPLGYYSKQNVPYGPAIDEILASNPDQPSAILTPDQQLAGNMRVFATHIPAITPADDGLDIDFEWGPDHPVLVIWRERRAGSPVPEMDAGLRDWLETRLGYSGRPETRYAALPYHHGREGDRYSFSYAWIYPAPGARDNPADPAG
jgi:4-amino-4-deoxy-L-arabinose transferase-like glycosyltransferase